MTWSQGELDKKTDEFIDLENAKLQKQLGNRLVEIIKEIMDDFSSRISEVLSASQLNHYLNNEYHYKIHRLLCEVNVETWRYIEKTGVQSAIAPGGELNLKPNEFLDVLLRGNAPIRMVSPIAIMAFQNEYKKQWRQWRDPTST